MIGLDTNILVRYLIQDDPVQSIQAASIMERLLTEEDPGFVSLVTVAELVWVLRSPYGYTSQQIAAALERMLLTPVLFIQNEREVLLALDVLQAGAGAFDDALIGALGRWAGCSRTLTFDRKAARLSDFQPA
jgi:predicted nucleic-acid-binding protein